MSAEEIRAMIEAEAKKLAESQAVEVKDEGSIYQLGAKLFIRTVTHYVVGRVCFVGPDEIGMTEAAWVADTGRFSDALKSGNFSEVEPFPGRMSVGRGAIVDATTWPHALPRAVV